MDEKDKLDDQQIELQELDQSAGSDSTEEQAQAESSEEQNEFQDDESEEKTDDAEESKSPTRRENLRIQQLVSKLRRQEDTSQQLTGSEELDYRKTLEAEDEVYKRLESDRQNYGESRYREGIKQAESIQFHTRLEIDAPKVHSKYPQFDPESSEFNPVAANAVNEWYLSQVGFNPSNNTVANSNIRYAEFVDSLMELADEMAGQKVATTQKNIAKQASSTGLRPDGSTAKRLNLNKAPESMTDEELEAVINSALTKKQ